MKDGLNGKDAPRSGDNIADGLPRQARSTDMIVVTGE